MGMSPPNNQQEVWQAVQQCDQNRDGRVNRMELLILFKRIQGVQGGYGMQQQGGFGQQHGQGGFGQQQGFGGGMQQW